MNTHSERTANSFITINTKKPKNMKDKKERLPNYADRKTLHITDSKENITAINKIFRQYDESFLWPINGRFCATERAIKTAQKFNRETGSDMAGLEYCLFLESEISRIVNSSI